MTNERASTHEPEHTPTCPIPDRVRVWDVNGVPEVCLSKSLVVGMSTAAIGLLALTLLTLFWSGPSVLSAHERSALETSSSRYDESPALRRLSEHEKRNIAARGGGADDILRRGRSQMDQYLNGQRGSLEAKLYLAQDEHARKEQSSRLKTKGALWILWLTAAVIIFVRGEQEMSRARALIAEYWGDAEPETGPGSEGLTESSAGRLYRGYARDQETGSPRVFEAHASSPAESLQSFEGRGADILVVLPAV